MTEFSIIVPVYQAHQYLERLITSILAQSYDKYELLLVDDGSSDGSEKICDKFSTKYKQIKTIHKENGGVSSARNCGIENAKGNYIIFLDADDYIDHDFLVDASKTIEKYQADIFVYGYYAESEKMLREFLPSLSGVYDNAIFSEMIPTFIQDEAFNSVWNKVFSARIINDNNLRFCSQKIAEDGIFVCQYLQSVSTIYFSNKSYYHYCQNENSAVHKFCECRWENEKNYLHEVEKYMSAVAPNDVKSVMGIKYRNAILFEVYNLVDSPYSCRNCVSLLKKYLIECYDCINWKTKNQEFKFRTQIWLLKHNCIGIVILLLRIRRSWKG